MYSGLRRACGVVGAVTVVWVYSSTYKGHMYSGMLSRQGFLGAGTGHHLRFDGRGFFLFLSSAQIPGKLGIIHRLASLTNNNHPSSKILPPASSSVERRVSVSVSPHPGMELFYYSRVGMVDPGILDQRNIHG